MCCTYDNIRQLTMMESIFIKCIFNVLFSKVFSAIIFFCLANRLSHSYHIYKGLILVMRSVENIRALKHTGATVKHLVFRLLTFCQDRLVSFCPLAWYQRKKDQRDRASEGKTERVLQVDRAGQENGKMQATREVNGRAWIYARVLVVLYCMYPCTFL